jgi:pyridoxal biosynthesis lyase PdxS
MPDAGSAVMALERVPADIRAQGGVSRMSDPDMIEAIIDQLYDSMFCILTPPRTMNEL